MLSIRLDTATCIIRFLLGLHFILISSLHFTILFGFESKNKLLFKQKQKKIERAKFQYLTFKNIQRELRFSWYNAILK